MTTDLRGRRPSLLRRLRLSAALLAAIAAHGCGNLTPGGVTGEAAIVVSGDLDPLAPGALGWSVLPQTAPVPPLRADEQAEGEVEVEVMLFLVSESGSVLRMGSDEIRVRVDVRGENEVDAVREPVPTGRYTELQIVFTEIKAEINAGLVINGVPVVGEIRVEFEDLTLPVSRPIDLDVFAGDTVELVVDLNTQSWLQAVDPVTETVDQAAVASLIDVIVR